MSSKGLFFLLYSIQAISGKGGFCLRKIPVCRSFISAETKKIRIDRH